MAGIIQILGDRAFAGFETCNISSSIKVEKLIKSSINVAKYHKWTIAQFQWVTLSRWIKAKVDPFLSLDCARVEGMGAQSKERKGSTCTA